MRQLVALIIISAIIGSSLGASAMTISSDQPGNLHTAKQPMLFQISAATSDVQFEMKDYFGKLITSGTGAITAGAATVRIEGCEPGWYELSCSDASETTKASVGVVIDRKGAPLPKDGRIGADAASAWLLHDDKLRKPFAKVVSRAGIPWIRERLRWESMERVPGRYDWSSIQPTVDNLSAEGINIFEVWHLTPEWARAKQPNGSYYPEDLRTVYNFTKQMAKHFEDQVQAWEPWNEPDGGFWPDLSDRCSGYLKAAYLGLKAGDADAIVTQCSLCIGPSNFSLGLYQNGMGNYYEIYNWHRYAAPAAYPGDLETYFKQLEPFKLNNRPSWLTEAGIVMKGSEGADKRLLSAPDEKLQCQFAARSAVMSLVAGNAKHFFFVLPEYLENGTQYGSMKPDLSPNPAFISLSAVVNILGQATYLGEYQLDNKDSHAYLFDTPNGRVLVAWSDKPTEVSLPVESSDARVRNIFGSESPVRAKNGAISVALSAEAVYITGMSDKVVSQLTGVVKPLGKMPVLNPSPIIMVGHSLAKVNKTNDSYVLFGAEYRQFEYTVEVYNFGTTPTGKGSVTLSAPKGWSVDKPTRSVQLPPMGREVLRFLVHPGHPKTGLFNLTASAVIGSTKLSPAASHFTFNLSDVVPTKRVSMGLLDATQWRPQVSAGDKVTISNPTPGSLRIDSQFFGEHDRWAYPDNTFKKPRDFSKHDGISFEMQCSSEGDGSLIQLMLVEKSGAHYIVGVPASKTRRRVTLQFSHMTHLDFLGADPDNKLTLDAISAVRLGCNSKSEHLVLTVSDLELVKF